MKLKVNEVGAVSALTSSVRQSITPFFDLPRKDGLNETSFRTLVEKGARKIQKHFGKKYPIYIDNFDIPDAVTVGGAANYHFVISEFSGTGFIPVVGLDRSPEHNQAVFAGKSKGGVSSERLALRLLEDDFLSFDLIEGDLNDLLKAGADAGFETFDLILDCKVCRNVNAVAHAALLGAFIAAARKQFEFGRVVVTGSSIPASIAEVAKVLQSSVIDRRELHIIAELRKHAAMNDLVLGDYTIVSPMYSEISMPPEMLLNVTAPKVLYSHENIHHIIRGGALRTHARGNLQYNDFAANLIGQSFYRGPSYSYGDHFLHERASMSGNMVTPGSILKPTINAHITYMATDHPLAI